MFKRRKADESGPPQPPGDVYAALRSQIFDLDPAAAGMPPGAGLPIWGAVLETGFAGGVATLVCLQDGTTSLYLSTGGGTIGAGAHPAVVAANEQFLIALAAHLADLTVSSDRGLPAEGRVIIRALGYGEQRVLEAAEEDLGRGRSPLSPTFHAAHAVISELRMLQENQSGGG